MKPLPHTRDSARVSTGLARLDALLGGGLLPGTLTVVYGATGIGKTHLGLAFAQQGLAQEAAPGILFDMNGRVDSQQHREYAERLFDWRLSPWKYEPAPWAPALPDFEAVAAMAYCDEYNHTGRVADVQEGRDGSREFSWSWKAAHNREFRRILPFFYFHFCLGCRRVVVDGLEPAGRGVESLQYHLFYEIYAQAIHRDFDVAAAEILIPVWKYRDFIQQRSYPHERIATLLLVTTEETTINDLIARRVTEGDPGALANTILLMGKTIHGGRVGRCFHVAKHRGSSCSDELAEYRIGDGGIEFVS